MKIEEKSFIRISTTKRDDGPSVHNLVNLCPPLDRNSRYLYLLVCTHFDRYSMTAKGGDDLMGFVSAYRHPAYDNTIFIWQVAVAPAYRKHGIASRILYEVILRAIQDGLTYLETTVTPSNTASFNMFKKIADTFNAGLQQSICFSSELLGDNHEEEMLLRIGPLKQQGRKL